MSSLVNRNITSLAGRTSMRLEPELWDALDEVCRRERCQRSDIIAIAEAAMVHGGRTSAVRAYLFDYFRAAAAEAGA